MRLWWRSGLVVLAFCSAAGMTRAAEPDYRKPLHDTRVDPRANQLRFHIDSAALTTRVLLAGDSWARYMWDDGSHNQIFDRFGQGDMQASSASLSSNPGPGYTGPEYAVDGTEAREWVDTANFPYLDNMLAALRANPDIDTVLLSIGGNDMLAGKSHGGWYKDMDLDTPGSEGALLDRVQNDTSTIVDSILAVRPDIQVLLSSYDYPNFNVGFWCFISACRMRRDLSRDPTEDLVTDEEINAMLVVFEATRVELANANERVHYDHSLGLLHHYFGDGVTGPYILPHPGQQPPLYDPFPGGNPLRPNLRALFRKPNNVDADPIHLNFTGYQYKITNEMQAYFLPRARGPVSASFVSEGVGRDGWTDGMLVATDGIAMGDNGAAPTAAIVSFDTAAIPDGASITRAALYLHRASLSGTNPFTSAQLGAVRVDVVSGSFGAPEVETTDATAPADAVDAGMVIGSASANGDAIRIEMDAAGLLALNDVGRTQFRLRFATTDGDADADFVTFHNGDATLPVPTGPPTLAQTLGTAAPFLDVTYDEATAVADGGTPQPPGRLLQVDPNPFNPSTRIAFDVPGTSPERVSLRVYDSAGRLVRTFLSNAWVPAGVQTIQWHGSDDQGRRLASGVYHLHLVMQGRSESAKLVLLK